MWNNWCTKYKSYSANNDYVGMMAILNQIIAQGYAANTYSAFTTLQARCLEAGFRGANTWTYPGTGEQRYLCENGQCYQNANGNFLSLAACQDACTPTGGHRGQKDCYNCEEEIMMRIPATQSCPKSWLSSPVNPSTLLSKNPCSPKARVTQSGGFSKGGRVRGGLKQPEFFSRPTNKFDAYNNGSGIVSDRPKGSGEPISPTDPTPPSRTYNGWYNGDFYSMGTRVSRMHPLDVAGAKRVIGSTYWDAWANNGKGMWKEDDGRPRGIDPDTGKKLCGGKCKRTKSLWEWISGSGSSQKCDCDRSGNGCACAGCMGSTEC